MTFVALKSYRQIIDSLGKGKESIGLILTKSSVTYKYSLQLENSNPYGPSESIFKFILSKILLLTTPVEVL